MRVADTKIKNIIRTCSIVGMASMAWLSYANIYSDYSTIQMITSPDDTSEIEMPYPYREKEQYPYQGPPQGNDLYLKDPANVKTEENYNPETQSYEFQQKVGNLPYGTPSQMSFEEYQSYDMNKAMRQYWNQRVTSSSGMKKGGFGPKINVGGEVFDRLFGSSTIDIRPQGSAELIFGVVGNRRDDPALDVRQRRTVNFDFQEKIQMNVTAKIGDKIQLGTTYNTEASFDFENKMKLAYEGKEDEVLKLIEAGDVTMPLTGTLISGAQSLFGIKTKWQFGRLYITTVFSQQKSQSSSIQVSGGAQVSKFNINADQYEDNKHFFFAQYFRDHYNKAMATLPVVNTPVNITKMEVWITNIGPPTQENRNILALMDLGEASPYNKKLAYSTTGSSTIPTNKINKLYNLVNKKEIREFTTVNAALNDLSASGYSLVSGIDYEKVENARKLASTEYTYNSKLGFISLNSTMNSDQVLGVAFEYTLIGDTTVYKVGDFANEGISGKQTLIVKLLKSTSQNTQIPLWDLMMKNVYALGAYQVNSEDFRFNVLYRDDEKGVPAGYFKIDANVSSVGGLPLIRVLGLDNLNTKMDPQPDGVFDFIDNAAKVGGTIQASNGRVFFPVLEPFGEDLRKAIDPANPNSALANKYAYDSLYSQTPVQAQQHPDKNKYILQGTYKSASGSDISLNAMNVPKGSVKVTAGGIALTEDVDYSVDYTLGRVKIINQGILNSGAPINVSFENNSMFAMQTKRLMGTHLDYIVNKNFKLGGTIMNLTERPLTQKINFNNEPINNTIWGLDGSYQTDSRLITKLLDKLPFYSTNTVSKVQLNGEFAHFMPGHSRAVGKAGTSYIDDFEGTKSSIDLKEYGSWSLASTPQNQADNFPEALPGTGLNYGKNRALFNWYIIDPLFLRTGQITPDHIKEDKNQQSNHFVREIIETEVFPYKEPVNNQPVNLAVLNLSFYPKERGPYNFDVEDGKYSAGINSSGELLNPASRWGGFMRRIVTTDFEATNVEYIEFWLMDPFVYNNQHSGGQLYFNLGDISEDILRDSRKSFENGLPTTAEVKNVDTTIWGHVPTDQALVNSFDNNPESRAFQDVGLDGLTSTQEKTFYESMFIKPIQNLFGTTSGAYTNAVKDPASDDYHYFRGDDFDEQEVSILNRYKLYNGMEGNSPTSEQYTTQNQKGFPTQSTSLPNVEDINRDNTLNEVERYFQYKVELKPDRMNIGDNYITDIYEADVELKNETKTKIKWYQFKIPIRTPDKVVGNIQDFKSIRFLRLYMRGFSEEIHCRFATLDLVRSEWRRYNYSLLGSGEYEQSDYDNSTFNISAVNLEENGKRKPIPYVLPPEINREVNIGTTNLQKLNEQSLSMEVCDLIDGDARAIYKTADIDVRQYKKIQMFVHAEQMDALHPLNDSDLTVFVRLGTDFTQNYYEFELPLVLTPDGTYKVDDEISEEDRKKIWPEANNMVINLSELTAVKMARNKAIRDGVISGVTEVFTYNDQLAGIRGHRISVVGVPNLESVRMLMLGVRNPRKTAKRPSDDMQPKCANIWLNELRLTDFDESGGWAALARVNATLADLGNVSVAGTISTPGFGSIEKKVNERQKETLKQYDVATNIELGKFLPKKSGIKLPMHYDFSQGISTPQYNPLDPDIELKEEFKDLNRTQRDSLKLMVQEYTKRKNLNFMNVRKEKTNLAAKSQIYDISNFDLSYSYSETEFNNSEYEVNLKKKYMGGLGYNFALNPKKIAPFSKVKLMQSKSFALLRDFHFFYAPKLIAFRTEMNRSFEEFMLRKNTTADIIIMPNYIKTFNWERVYNLKYDFSQNLKFDFNANATSRIDEPPGKIDKAARDSIMTNIKQMGRITMYDQKATMNYNLPINKIPFFNWVTASYSYNGEYHWTAPPMSALVFGSTIENGNGHQVNGNFNLVNFYNKIPYLKGINSPVKKKPSTPPKIEMKPKALNPADTLNKKKSLKEKKDSTEKGPNYFKIIADNTLRIIMSVRTAGIMYSENNGTLIPGFVFEPEMGGMKLNNMAPGVGFVFGLQDGDMGTSRGIREMHRKNWLTDTTNLNQPYQEKLTQNLSINATIEPLKDLKVNLTGTTNYSLTNSAYYQESNGEFIPTSEKLNGSFSMTVIALKTSFIGDDEAHSSKLFAQFKENRIIIAQRLFEANINGQQGYYTAADSLPNAIDYPQGYGPSSQQVLIPAFLAAYTGRDANTIMIDDPFFGKTSKDLWKKIPAPNWRLTYNGLSKLALVKKYFKSVTLSHGYSAKYNVGSFTRSIRYAEDVDGFSIIRDELGERNYLPRDEINQVMLTEQFSPLLSINMDWKNSLITKVEVKTSRNESLSFSNYQLTEIKTSEMIVGLGYRFKEVIFNVKTAGKKTQLKSDLTLKADVSLRSNKTMLRKLVEEVEVPSAGQRVLSINLSADYQISQQFTVRVFFDNVRTKPFVSNQFYNANTNAGVSMRFTLAQ